jgi:hypothetical protein
MRNAFRSLLIGALGIAFLACTSRVEGNRSGDVTTTGDADTGDADTVGADTSGDADDASAVSDTDLADLTANEQLLVNLPPDSWYKVPAGFITQCDDTYGTQWHAIDGCNGIFAWSSGVYDSASNQFLLWGGGHNDYAGNEVYAFHLSTFEWERLTTPSLGPYNQDPLDDGKPVARHTYDSLTWLTDAKRMFAIGGSRANDGAGTGITWTFDPVTKEWTNLAPPAFPHGGYDCSSVYDEVTQNVFFWVGPFWRYDIPSNQWIVIDGGGFPPYWPRYAGGNPRGTLDTKRRNLWLLGGNLYAIYNIDQQAFVTDDWVTTGAGEFTNASNPTISQYYPDQVITTGGNELISVPAPGLDYDSKADSLVGWKGGAPYELNLTTKVWTEKNGTDAPPQQISVGTFGRWRYVAKYNVFILINGPDEVYFYKNTAGGGT